MTVPTTSNRQDFTVNGTGPYTYSRKVYDATTIQVWTIDENDLKDTQATYNVDYFVTVAQDNDSAEITLSSAYATAQDGNDIMVLRVLPYTQETDFQANNTLNEEFVELALDEQVMRMQQLAEDFSQINVRFTNFEDNTVTQVEADLAKAKEWATKAEDDPVETGPNQFSALHHAAKASASASAASSSASTASGAASTATSARDDAEAARDKAEQWADEAEDTPVETGPDRFSAFHWAQKALAAAGVNLPSASDVGKFVKATAEDTIEWASLTFSDITGTLGIAKGGTGQTTAAGAFNALKQAATESASGVLEKSTDGEIRSAAPGTKAICAEDLESAAAIQTLSDAATISVDWDTFINGEVTLGGNRTLGNPTNGQPGTWRRISIAQDGSGSRTLSWGSNYEFPASEAPTLSTAANARDTFSIFCRTASAFEVYTAGQEMG